MSDLELLSSAGALAALYDEPRGDPPASGPLAAVVCHPYPPLGGRMDNKVVHSIAKTLAARGLHVVRFNFRGYGGSAGIHDHGRGERDDVRAALDHAASLVEGGTLLVAGFSFGAYVGLTAALDDPRVCGLLAVAPPVNHYDFEPVARADMPLSVIYSRADELVPDDQVEAWIARCRRPPMVTVVPDASHLFHGHLAHVRAAVDAFVDTLAAT